MDADQKLFTFQEAAEILNVSVRTIFVWRKKGQIQTIKLGGANRIRREELEKIMTKGTSV